MVSPYPVSAEALLAAHGGPSFAPAPTASASAFGSSSGIRFSGSKDEKEQMVLRMIAERRARLPAEARGAPTAVVDTTSAVGSLRPAPAASLPPVPPVVAALQAQAAAAAASAVAAIASASISARNVGTGLHSPPPAPAPAPAPTRTTTASAARAVAFKDDLDVAPSPPASSSAARPSGPALTSAARAAVSPAGVAAGAATDAADPAQATSPRQASRSPRPVGTTSQSGRAGSRSGGGGALASPVSSPALESPTASAPGSGGGGKNFRRRTAEEIKAEREATLYGECTFRPGTKGASASSKPRGSAERGRPSRESMFEHLAKSKAMTYEERERQRKEREEEELRAACTFQPRVRSTSKSPVPHRGSDEENDDEGAATAARADVHQHRPAQATRAPSPRALQAPVVHVAVPRGGAPAHGAPLPPAPMQSPPKPGSPLQWERSLSRKYLDGMAGARPATASVPAPVPAPAAAPAPAPPPAKPAAAAAAAPGAKAPAPLPPAPAAPPPSRPAPPAPGPPPSSSPAEQHRERVPPVVARLYAHAELREMERKKAKAAVDRAQMAVFSFRPAINPTSVAILSQAEAEAAAASSAAAAATAAPAPVHRPLHERTADLQRAKAEHVHRLRMESLLSNPELTFAPKINETSKRIAIEKAKMAGQPISDDGIGNGASPSAASAAAAGGPDILPNGAAAAGGSPDAAARRIPASIAATKRLTQEGVDAAARREARRRAAQSAEAQRYSFQPRVNAHSEHLVETKLKERAQELGSAPAPAPGAPVPTPGAGPPSFYERQRVMLELQKRHKAAIVEEIRKGDECKFRPDIGNADEILALTRPQLVTETDGARVQRLSVEESAHRARTQAEARKEYYDKFTFKPEINASSRQRGRAHTVEEHVKNEQGQRVRLRAKAIAEAEFVEKHPFQPTLVASAPPEHHHNRRSRSKDSAEGGGPSTSPGRPPALGRAADGEEDGASDAGRAAPPLRLAVRSDPEHISERIAEHLKAKAERNEAVKRLVDVEQLKECTFQPETAASARSHAKLKDAVAADGGVVVVRGLGRYLELKELQRKLDDEKRCVRGERWCGGTADE
jgi:hypothetical protein